ncbi:hypothetical protein BDN72DRAFT_259470 [Pluteus cervinus]|uniref:Uncharacterized protein n=1 Tax=Pluteus cervinus TaxID=181527 RepID=A0ACD3B7W5_9AGAR|nr:hypothetical protein BDN72DRAFT_259470 [Pluteus cervinus]
MTQLLLGLIFFGSTAAFNAFVGVAVMCLGASYAMPIGTLLWRNSPFWVEDDKGDGGSVDSKRQGGKGKGIGRRGVEDAQFSLGRWGTIINIFAILWISLPGVVFDAGGYTCY